MDWLAVLNERIWYAVRYYQLTRDLERITQRTYDLRWPRLTITPVADVYRRRMQWRE